ncbi:MAG: hypothetical protein K8U03_18335 [Planctomycetia bacterium]|nr:hypothetical protein [Planctomycetia bacterium]
MTVLHSGTTKKFSANWGNVFGSSGAKAQAAAKPQAKDAKTNVKVKAAKKDAAPKVAAKPAPAKKTKAKKK